MFDHPEENALYRAILEAPFDDALRLIYADWQDEYGNSEFAELIRLQIYGSSCTVACTSDEGHSKDCGNARESSLLNTKNMWKWFRSITFPTVIRHGFPSTVSVSSIETGIKVVGSAVENHPICKVMINDREPEITENGKLFRWNYRSERFPNSVLPGFAFRMMSAGNDLRVPVVFGSVEEAKNTLSFAVLNSVRVAYKLPILTKESIRGE